MLYAQRINKGKSKLLLFSLMIIILSTIVYGVVEDHWWTFDNVATDSVGSIDFTANDGATFTGTYVKLGSYAATLDGTNDRFTSSTAPAWGTNDFSICVWVRATKDLGAENDDVIISKTGSATWRYQQHAPDDYVDWYGPGYDKRTSFSIADSAYHLFCTVRSSNNLAFYVDNSLVSTNQSSESSNYDSAVWELGEYFDNGGFNWQGQFDDMRTWPCALSGIAQSDLYNSGSGTTSSVDCTTGAVGSPVIDNSSVVITSVNLTSNGFSGGDITDPMNASGDATPTFTFDTGITADCDISDDNNSYVYACLTTNSTTHSCTLNYDEHLITDPDKVYFRCNNAANGGGNYTYIYQNITNGASGTPSGTGDTVELVQYIQVKDYTSTNIDYLRFVKAFNYYGSQKTFTIPTLNGWQIINGSTSMIVQSQSSNYTSYNRSYERGINDLTLHLGPVNTTTTVATSNALHFIIPGDPPLKSCTFTQSRIVNDVNLTCDSMEIIGNTKIDFINSNISINKSLILDVLGNITLSNSPLIIGNYYSNISYSYCYQEFANISTGCGGLSTGKYGFGDSAFTNPSNIYDGDYGTYGNSGTSTGYYHYYVNYTLPSNIVDVILQMKYSQGSKELLSAYCYNYSLVDSFTELFSGTQTTETINVTVGNDCWSSNPLRLRLTSQVLLTSATGKFYEEGVWWNITS